MTKILDTDSFLNNDKLRVKVTAHNPIKRHLPKKLFLSSDNSLKTVLEKPNKVEIPKRRDKNSMEVIALNLEKQESTNVPNSF